MSSEGTSGHEHERERRKEQRHPHKERPHERGPHKGHEPHVKKASGDPPDGDPPAPRLEDVTSVPTIMTFGNGTVNVIVTIPIADPPVTNLQLYGASNDDNPSSSPGNELAESANRPASGHLDDPTAPYTPNEFYKVQLKFFQGANRTTLSTKVLAADAHDGSTVTPNLD